MVTVNSSLSTVAAVPSILGATLVTVGRGSIVTVPSARALGTGPAAATTSTSKTTRKRPPPTRLIGPFARPGRDRFSIAATPALQPRQVPPEPMIQAVGPLIQGI